MLPKKTEESMPIKVQMIDSIDKNVHEPSRLKILAHLYALEKTDFTYLKNITDFSWGRLSSHLDKLKEAKYVKMEKKLIRKGRQGKKTPKTFISLTYIGRQAFEEYKRSMRELFS